MCIRDRCQDFPRRRRNFDQLCQFLRGPRLADLCMCLKIPVWKIHRWCMAYHQQANRGITVRPWWITRPGFPCPAIQKFPDRRCRLHPQSFNPARPDRAWISPTTIRPLALTLPLTSVDRRMQKFFSPLQCFSRTTEMGWTHQQREMMLSQRVAKLSSMKPLQERSLRVIILSDSRLAASVSLLNPLSKINRVENFSGTELPGHPQKYFSHEILTP